MDSRTDPASIADASASVSKRPFESVECDSSPASDSLKFRKFRTPQACDRCHRRKQRCDGNAQCHPCQQAGVECTTTDKTSLRTVTRSLLPELEERIHWLESLIHQQNPSLDIRSISTGEKVVMNPTPATDAYITDPPRPQPAVPVRGQPFSSIAELSFPEELEPKGNLFLDPALESGDSYIPPQAPSTYGVYARKHAQVEVNSQPEQSANSIFAATIRAGSQTTPITAMPNYPPFAIAKSYLDCYFFHNHTNAPFLHHASLRQRFYAFYATQFIDQPYQWIFVLNMVLAIGQTTLIRQEALKGKHHEDAGYRFFDTAMSLLEPSIRSTSITTIQCLLLLATYGLQHPQAVSIYRIVAQAMRICIELSLHRTQSRKDTLTPLDREMRKRIFWSAYSLDRFVSVALGRPCSIADECISCELPMDLDDASMQRDPLIPVSPGSMSEMTFSLSIFKLRRIQGRIIQTLYCSTQSATTNQSILVDRFVVELEAWRLTIPGSDRDRGAHSIVPSVFKTNAWFNLCYWHARLLLYRFLAPRGLPHDLRHCAEAAIQSVKLYAVLLDERRININWSTLALCFTAGVTLLWCVYLAPNSTLDPAISMRDVEDAMHCTERVLAALSDIWPAAAKCGNLYRTLCQNVVVVEQSGAMLGVRNNVMDQLDMSFNTLAPHDTDNVIGYATMPPNPGDSVEAFEQLGWTLGGFNG